MGFETFVIMVAVVIFLLVVSMASSRRDAERTGFRLCQSCGAGHPPFAQYCRRCGQRL